MKYRKLGRTGVLVSELSFGAMTFGGQGAWSAIGSLGRPEVEQLVSQALAAGVNLFDTANVYSDGESERLLGLALGTRRKEILLATKVAERTGPGANEVGLTRRHVLAAVESSLERLGTDYIDLYQIHCFDPVTPIEETLRALDDLVRAGKVRYIGCSNLAAWQLMKALGLSRQHGWERFESLQAYYSVVSRDVEREVIPLLDDEQVGLLVWSPLAGGLLTDRLGGGESPPGSFRRARIDFPPVDREHALQCFAPLKRIAVARGVPVTTIALAWILHQKAVTSVILGATTPEQLKENLLASELCLEPEELRQIDRASALRMEYPQWLQAASYLDRLPD
jgi:aryl-alcohol dehydrogenase-like predicted oxidoreductase